MTVLLPNCNATVRRVTAARGAFGDAVTQQPGPAVGPGLPAAKREQQDGTWRINLDPSLWPVRVNDRVLDTDTGREYVVRTAQNVTHAEVPEIEHVRVTAVEITGAGAEPGVPADVGTP